MKTLINKIPRFIRNKYFITFIVFVVWMLFFDQNNMISQYRLTKKVNELQQEKEFYETEIKKDRKAAADLKSNIETLEKYARETYLMKREDEDIFLIVEEEAD
ncbi:MAG: septum formation initiator family protein [Bacteroidales bacterium]